MKITKRYNKLQFTKDEAIQSFTTSIENKNTLLKKYGLSLAFTWKLDVDELTDAQDYILTWSNSEKSFNESQEALFQSFLQAL